MTSSLYSREGGTSTELTAAITIRWAQDHSSIDLQCYLELIIRSAASEIATDFSRTRSKINFNGGEKNGAATSTDEYICSEHSSRESSTSWSGLNIPQYSELFN